MHAISALVILMALLILLAGVAVMLGVKRSGRGVGVAFFLACLMAGLWSGAIAVFLSLPADAEALAPAVVLVLYSAAIPMMLCMLVFLTGRTVAGRVAAVFFGIFGVGLLALLWADPGQLYTGIVLGETNRVLLVSGAYYWAYTAFLVLIASISLALTLYRILQSDSRSERAGLTVMLGGFFGAAVFYVIFDVWLPLTRYDLIWWEPVSMCFILGTYFYTALKYHVITLASRALRFLSFVVLSAFVATITMFLFVLGLFYFLQTEISDAMLVATLVLVFVLVAVIPLFSQLNAVVQSLFSAQTVNVSGVLKNYNHYLGESLELDKLAERLANDLCLSYLGFYVCGQIYGSRRIRHSGELAWELTKFSPPPAKSLWLNFRVVPKLEQCCAQHRIVAVARLRNARGEACGFLLVGQPLGKDTCEPEDLVALGQMTNLIGVSVDSRLHLRGEPAGWKEPND